jgi:hypothetical protein
MKKYQDKERSEKKYKTETKFLRRRKNLMPIFLPNNFKKKLAKLATFK